VQGDAAVSEAWLVKLEFERVQTYLFAVPELKAMIGANTLIGETLRGALVQDGSGGYSFGAARDSLPALAVNCGSPSGLPTGIDPPSLGVPAADVTDPLQGKDCDNPLEAWKLGILSRDGGHLHAIFPSPEQARCFVTRARMLVGKRLHGLLLSARLAKLSDSGGKWESKEEPLAANGDLGESVADLPQLQVCQITGQGPAATDRVRDGRTYWIAQSVEHRERKAREFDRGVSCDVLGLLRRPIATALGLSPDDENLFPTEFEKVAPSGYLAVIAADGNGMGKRFWKYRKPDTEEPPFFAGEARGEKFFHSMRVAVRKALLDALAETFALAARLVGDKKREQMPFRLLMLGGDDLLLVCDAPYALPFVRYYAAKLAGHKLANGEPLTIGAGVAVVKSKFPFHRSHDLAEQLAKSSKRLFRELKAKEPASVVDWVAVSEAWHEDVAEVRRRDFRRSYRNAAGNEEMLVLSCKPYPVLGKERLSLEKLLAGVEEGRGRLPRSQLMALVEGVRHGRLQADHHVHLLDGEFRQALAPALGGPADDPTAWLPTGRDDWHRTALLDFLEIYELERMRDEPEEGGND
jgi:hypothetical protein